MAENLHEDELLLNYLDGALSDEAAAALEQQLQDDPALLERLDSLKITAESVKLFGIHQEVAAARRQWEQESTGNTRAAGRVISMSRKLRYAVLAAACFMLLIVGVKYFWFSGLSSDQV